MAKSPDVPNTNAVLEALAAHGLARELLQPTGERWLLRVVEAGRSYARRGQLAQALMVVLEGELAVRAQKMDVGRVERGAFVGLALCIVKGGAHPHDLIATQRTVVAELPAETLLTLRRGREAVYEALLDLELRTLAGRHAERDARYLAVRVGTFPLQTRPSGSVLGRLWQQLRLRRVEAGQPIEPLLRALPGLQRAPDAVIAEIGAAFRPRSFAAQQVISLEGAQADSVYLVASGQVDVLRRARNDAGVMLAALREGSLFGMVSLLSGCPRVTSCVAAEDTTLYEMPRAAFMALGPTARCMWRECLLTVLHRRLCEAYVSLVAALRVFDTTNAVGPQGADQSLHMFVSTTRDPGDSGAPDGEPE